MTQAIDLSSFIRDVPDFPTAGIVFKDITPLLKNGSAFKEAVQQIAKPFLNKGVTAVACVEARGFIFGTAVSSFLGVGMIPVRKKGKLPHNTYETTYSLEYGEDTLAIHKDALTDRDQVLIVDDLLATGGTVGATLDLIKQCQAKTIGITCLIELEFLNARQKFESTPLHSVLQY